MTQLRRGLAVALLVISGSAGSSAPAAADEDDLLNYCLARVKACAISVEAVDEGWQGHWNADRPQSLASTFKILVLLAYAQAVADGVVSPDDTVDKNLWGRYFSGNPVLARSWNDLGQPDRVRLDDLARVMILNSDNAATDLFMARLNKQRFVRAAKLFDWHDVPAPISAMFGLWQNLNGIGGTGNRVAADYGGFETSGYQKKLMKFALDLKKPAFVDTVRASLCAQPPWLPGPPPCDRARPSTTQRNLRILENHHFNRGTTRAYAALMRQLLDRSLLAPAAQEVVDRNLDQAWLDKFPTLSPTFLRYGTKSGSLAARAGLQVLTWAHYMETVRGRFVVTVFLQDMLSTRNAPTVSDVNRFAQQFALNAAFRQRVRDAIGGATLATELAPKINGITTQGNTVTVRAEAWNTSPVASGAAIKVSMFLLDDANPTGKTAVKSKRIGPLAGYKKRVFTLRATAAQDITGKLAVLAIDPDDEIAEQDDKNNVTWERLK